MPDLIAQRPFRRYWLGEIATTLGHQFLVIAIGWQLYEITNSALSLGLVGLVQFLSQVLFTLYAGHAADRYDRRRIVVGCQVVQGAIAVVLAAGSTNSSREKNCTSPTRPRLTALLVNSYICHPTAITSI